MSDSVWPHRRQPSRLPHPWDSPGKNTGVGCHFLLQCMKVKGKSLSHVWLLVTPWATAYQAPPSMGFSRQEYWSGVPLPSPQRSLAGYNPWDHRSWTRFLVTKPPPCLPLQPQVIRKWRMVQPHWPCSSSSNMLTMLSPSVPLHQLVPHLEHYSLSLHAWLFLLFRSQIATSPESPSLPTQLEVG